MGTTMNKAAFMQLIAEDVAWIRRFPHTLEARHIIEILEDSVNHYYPHPSMDPAWAEKRAAQEEGHDVTAGGELAQADVAYAQSVTQSVEAMPELQKVAAVEQVLKTNKYDSPLLHQVEFQKKRGYKYFGYDASTRQYLWEKDDLLRVPVTDTGVRVSQEETSS